MGINLYLVESFKKLGKTQKDVVADLGKPQPYISALMNGKKKVGKEVAKQLSDLYGFDIGSILTGESSQNDKKFYNISKQEPLFVSEPTSNVRMIDKSVEPEYLKTKTGIEYFIYPNNDTYVEVHKLRFKAYASYMEAFTDDGQFNAIDGSKVRFKVDQVGYGYYLGFETVNESMNGGGIDDTPGGADVLGRELQRHHWRDGFKHVRYGWILLTKNNIYHKDIKEFNIETGQLILSSRDGVTRDFEVSINDVYRIFRVIKRNF